MPERLTPLDGSFLRVETANAHMHVAWCASLKPPKGRPGPGLDALRAAVDARLERTPRFRRRLAFPPSGMGEPFWVDDEGFAIERHVTLLCDPDERPDARRFAALADRALSEPLDRTRPLWRVYLVPKLADGTAGMVAKFHHALVDGKSAVEVAVLLFDVTPDAEPAPAPEWRPEPEPGNGSARDGSARGERIGVAASGAGPGTDGRDPALERRAPLRQRAPGGAHRRRRPVATGARLLPQRAHRAAARWCATGPPSARS